MASFGKKFVQATLASDNLSEWRFEPNWVSFYESMPIEEFNAILEAEILMLRVRYRFSANSHGDWVCPHSWYVIASAIGNINEKEHMRPLNSWALKDPVALVPTMECLKEEVSWRKILAKSFFKGELVETSLDNVVSSYIREACKEMLICERLLLEWRRLGGGEDQEDWTFESEADKKLFRSKMKYQRRNMMDARTKLELFRKTGAPEFLICQASGQSVREKEMLDKMHEALLVRN
jgi:hypothetical protein